MHNGRVDKENSHNPERSVWGRVVRGKSQHHSVQLLIQCGLDTAHKSCWMVRSEEVYRPSEAQRWAAHGSQSSSVHHTHTALRSRGCRA